MIKKKLRGKASIRVVKKSIAGRAIDKIQKGAIKNFKEKLKEDQALIFSKLDPFELSSILSKNKSMARAKVGQKVDEEVVIEPGPTELVPGPIISELGSLGLKFAIEDGKISIKERKVILKAGQEVKEKEVSIMTKLDIKPVAIGLEPVIAYDSQEDKIYENIKIDSEKTIEELRREAGKSLGFAVKIAYCCKETIKALLRRAGSEKKVLESRIKYEKEGIATTSEELEEAKKSLENIQENKLDKEEN